MKKTILVTGAHRSGTTWVGRIISSAKGVKYVHEPFNVHINGSGIPLKWPYQYVSDNSPKNLQEDILTYLKSHYQPGFSNFSQIYGARPLKGYINFAKDFIESFSCKHALIKDPLALLSTEWLYSNLDCKVVICIRHPAAFVASLKVKGWFFDFSNIVDQKELISVHFPQYKEQIYSFAKDKRSIIEQGALLWNMLYGVVLDYNYKFQNSWYFVVHEELSKKPQIEFKKIFEYLDVNISSKTRALIESSSQKRQNHDLFRNSAENIHTWKLRLSSEEINFIKENTNSVWRNFYSEESWI